MSDKRDADSSRWTGLFRWGKGEDKTADQRMRRVLETNRLLLAEHQPRRLYATLLDAAVELSGAERAFLILLDSTSGEPRVEVARSVDREEVKAALGKISRTVVDKVAKSRLSVLTDSAQEDASIGPSASIAELKLRSILAVPLLVRGESIGCLYLDNRFQRGTFRDEHREMMELFADQAAIAVENARLHAENELRRQELERLNAELRKRVEVQEVELKSVRTTIEQQLSQASLRHEFSEIIGRSPPMMELLRMIDVAVDTDYPVLILGESGTGKEKVAQAIHHYGRRGRGPFVGENCAAIPENLLEAELFGYVRGAFTGADRDKNGLFEQAHGGTLFLDEIGDMDSSMQKKLLRVLEEGEFRKVGAREPIKVDVRILSATNVDLLERLEEGSFREDLYYRLKVISIRVPPLRERRTDIPELAEHFLRRAAAEDGRRPPAVSKEAMAILTSYSWPGNVRELRNEVLRLSALAKEEIGVELLKDLGRGKKQPHLSLAGRTLADIEKDAILQALEATRGKRVDAARMLGLPRRTFYNRLKRYGLL